MRLLDHPLRTRAVGAAGEMNSAAAHLYKEENVEPGQPDRVYAEEVRGEDLVGVLTNELPPGALAAAWCRLQAMASEHLAHGEVGTAVTQFEQVANDARRDRIGSPPRDNAGYQLSLIPMRANLRILPTDKCTVRMPAAGEQQA